VYIQIGVFSPLVALTGLYNSFGHIYVITVWDVREVNSGTSFPSVDGLCCAYRNTHSLLPYTIYFHFVDLFGKAKKKILKLDEETVSSDYEGQARPASTSQFTSSYIPVDTEPQEIGKNDSGRNVFCLVIFLRLSVHYMKKIRMKNKQTSFCDHSFVIIGTV